MTRGESDVSRSEHLRTVYNAGYFHGVNSGYPEEGYESHHPDWEQWLVRIAKLLSPGSRWLDLGCAYGFLVEQARARGYRAVGCDVSRYALAQNASIQAFLAEADALLLPFRSGSLQMITVFDLLEHLQSPQQTIGEIYRCLSPDGLAIVTTPDPCRFSGQEPTHIHERAPVQWISLFEDAGFCCNFGFDGADFNLVLAASKLKERVENFHEVLFGTYPVVVPQGEALLPAVRVRRGLHPSQEGWILGEENELYLYNPSAAPVAVSVQFSARTTGHNGALLLIADGRVVDRIEFLSAIDEFTFKRDNILLSSGGHSLRFELDDGKHAGQIRMGRITLQATPASPESLTSELPFDLFERYRTAAALYRRLRPQPFSVLDFGGYIGDRGGHWADASDFGLPALFTDIRPADSCRYLRLSSLQKRQFDMVLAIDVLEHVPPRDRREFLERLDSLSSEYLLLAGPFASPETEAAEKAVREALRKAGAGDHGFLAEHDSHGLPGRDELLHWISEKGYDFLEFEGMSAAMWQTLQTTSLILAHLQQYGALRQLNRIVNAVPLWFSAGRPYRRFFLVSKTARVEGIQPLPAATEPVELLSFLAAQPEILSGGTIRRRTEMLFLLNETQRHVQLLQSNAAELEKHAAELEKHAAELEKHAAELEKLLQAERQKPIARIFWERVRRRITGDHE
ncbi:MAG: class I SAM-dependent methyltransferase [Acidobacteria bacterium]|nr:class I SAM-dependent methyltransferase [Acidobacteriota bacterium]